MIRHFGRVGAFLSGLGLVIASVYIGGYLAALPIIPKAYFAFFGHAHERLALAILGGVTKALPFFLLSIVWCWLTLRGKSSALRVAVWCCLAGMVVGLIGVQVWSALDLRSAEALVDPSSFFADLWRVTPSWWNFAPMLAFPGGLLVATILSHRTAVRYR